MPCLEESELSIILRNG